MKETVRTDSSPGLPVPWRDFVLLGLGGCLAFYPLTRFWNANPEYLFGWFVPFLAAYLFYERWEARPYPRASAVPGISLLFLGGGGFLFLLGTRLIIETEPDWRPGLWLFSSLFVGGILIWLALYGGRAWVRHFAFPVGFLLLSVPWPFNLEFPIVQGLMRWNANLVADSLVLADLPAQAVGNIIQLPSGSLGVNEACSGIRSLQAALMMSLFLGDFYRLSLSRRLMLPAAAVLMAMVGNYVRLLFLGWQGSLHGVATVESVHDSAGFLILIVTVAGLWLLCLCMGTSSMPRPAPTAPAMLSPSKRQGRLAWQFAGGLMLSLFLSEVLTQGWYAWRDRSAPRFPAWAIILPQTADHFEALSIPEETRVLLQYDDERAGRWRDGQGWRWTTFWFRYQPRSSNKIVFDSHNPEICLPGAGLHKLAEYEPFQEEVGEIRLPVHAYLFSAGTQNDYVFWVTYRNRGNLPDADGRHGIYGSSLSAFFQRSTAWVRDAWMGCRGTDAQTLEVTLRGPPDYPAARQAFRAFVDQALVPEKEKALTSVSR